ncbi:MAG TPA: MopE-related protein, partial [Polyangiaceae bacterium LLY-WYZ-15_(1-7)]|nr:MopE-related protein [Polyangiaceae bacterium LLY-WYZ-15_(1-7)]
MQKIVWGVGWLWIGVLAGACGGGEDVGDPDGGVTLCTSNAVCSDGVFCNGAERCAPEESGADARGCVTGAAPCFAGQECSEDEGRCVTVDCSSPDLDGDGVDSIDCGGEDCDDGDAERYPGNAELCDDLGKDEDCDPDTLGPDEDGDGYAPLACCNGTRCGLDCDDTRDGVSPEAVEACNGIDEDCDGDLDEGATEVFYRDLDGDGFGDPSTGVERACVEDPLFRRQADDCDDRDPATHPGAEEVCDGVDNDCNPATAFDQDGDGDGHLRVDAPCEGGPFPKDDCDDGNPFAHGGAVERCSAVDDDCDGAIDEEAANDWCTAQARLGDDTEATALCGVAASCVLSACGAGSADCDGVVANGCEVDTMGDAANCGGCGVACSSGSCVDGLCAPEPGLAEDERMVALRANGSAACGVTDGGHAICWGEVLPFESHARPAPLRDRGGLLSGVVDVGIGRECLCALKDDGTVVCMGNTDGFGEPSQCGATGSDEVFVVDPLPVLAGGSPITDASRLTLGNGYGCLVRGGVDVGGTSYTDAVMCWGSGGLGDGTYEGSNEPVVVQRAGGAPLDRVTDLDGGAQAACAVRDREVWCWGRDSTIHGTDGRRATRVRRSGGALLRADAVEVGEEIACALDGSALWCWGVNYNGVLGSGLLDDFAYEEAQPIPGAWAEVAPMQERNGQEEHVCGRRLSGELECWGDQAFTPGVPCYGDDRPCIVEPQGAAPFTTVTTGSSVSCALAEGWPWCWGWADEAQLGFDTTSFDARFPLPIPRTAPPVEIAAGFLGGCARTADGRVACWGSDLYRGEVGPDPARAAFPMAGVAEAAQVAVGLSSVCVRGGDGSVRCWGGSFDDDYGFLGGESARPSDDAYAIPGLPRAVELAVGNAHGCVIGDDASVWCWGESAA